MFKTRTSKEKALQKLKHYCGYQERCHQEVAEKLYGLGMYKNEVEEITSDLIAENYLNEERFAIRFAEGKFRIKHWGKTKIRYEMKQKRLSDYCIKKGLASIPEEDYLKTFHKLADKKWKSLKGEKNIFVKKTKWQNHLLQKGYEAALFRNYEFIP